MLERECPEITGESPVTLRDYTREIVASGFPAIRSLSGRALRAQLESYIARVVDKDFQELGYSVRDPDLLLRWMRAYAAASSTTATLETIRDAATSGEGTKPSRDSVLAYRSALERLWLLDPVRAWLPSRNQIARLARPDKHHLVDPALAASLLDITPASTSPEMARCSAASSSSWLRKASGCTRRPERRRFGTCGPRTGATRSI